MNEKPLPCPFCGGKAWEPEFRGRDYYRVSCGRDSCDAEGPWRKTIIGAIKAWNRRATPQP